VPGPVTPLPWPSGGEAAVTIPSLGFSAESAAETPVPVASMTKVMTAYLVLHDHPLSVGEDGPSLTMTAADASDFVNTVDQGGASVQVNAGEPLTELQLLEGLLVHSADNLADTLAIWDAGSIQAFVAKMNATAAALGMPATHFVDASGLNPASVSTPSDLLRVASLAMAEPTFRAIVSMSSVTLPVAGLLHSYTPFVGTNGVIGVKSGFTSQAGGCDILAIEPTVGGQQLLVLAAVTGEKTGAVLAEAGLQALHVATVAASSLVAVPLAPGGAAVGRAQEPGNSVPVVVEGDPVIVALPGQVIDERVVVTHRPRPGAARGTTVGYATFVLGGQRLTLRVATAARLPKPSPLQRLF
jgi:serine-type D-Ala-D-Ala carboxypeptidase (penicillin-binding protein 5/6)